MYPALRFSGTNLQRDPNNEREAVAATRLSTSYSSCFDIR
jgi:hypothetical protein